MARRGRKKKKRLFIPVVFLCGVVIICIFLTGMIVQSMLTGKTSTAKGKNFFLKNVYIIGKNGDRIRVCYEDKLYDFKGNLKEDFQGIGDLEVKDGTITKCVQKPDTVEGVLLSYTSGNMEIGNLGKCERNKELPVYRKDGNIVRGGGLKDLIVGVSRLTYVFEKGKICAVIQNGQQKITSIRVLIKNEDKERYKNLYLSAEDTWTADKEEKAKNQVCSAKDFFKNSQKKSVTVQCDKGLLYVCSRKGKKKGQPFHGSFIIHKVKGGYVLVNELPLEQYVGGVLPSEMPAEYKLEALKAQAVCARTFAYTQMKGDKYAKYGANLDDSTDFQVYNSQNRTKETEQAVAETAQQLLTYKGSPARCYYYSTSPGVTGDLSLWQDQPVDYLKRVNGLKGTDPGALQKEDVFKSYILSTPDSWDSSSPYYRWNAVVDLSKISDPEYGRLKKIEISKRSESGYVTNLSASFEKGKRTLENENRIRALLGGGLGKLTLSDGSTRTLSMLPSACFALIRQENGKCEIRGGGFGHGIGMSQCGAGSLGAAGKTYQEILRFYYPGTEIQTVDVMDK